MGKQVELKRLATVWKPKVRLEALEQAAHMRRGSIRRRSRVSRRSRNSRSPLVCSMRAATYGTLALRKRAG